MSHAKRRPPIQLAGIQGGGYAKDGDSISFLLEAQNGQTFNFSVPHEAIGEIVAALLALAEQASARRPRAVIPASGTPHRVERAFPLERYLVSGVPEDGTMMLTLYARSIEYSVLIQRADAQQMGEALLSATKRIAN